MSLTTLAKIKAEQDALRAQLAAADQKAADARRARASEIAGLFEKSDLILMSNAQIISLIRFGENQPKTWWEEIAKTGSGSFRRNGGKHAARGAAAQPPAATNPEPTPGPTDGDVGQTRTDGAAADAPGGAASAH
jgi:hypothetical protein